MNKYFSFNRWWLLVKKQWGENAKMYLLGMLAIAGLMTLGFFLWTIAYNSEQAYEEEVIYLLGITGLFISGTIFSSMAFSNLSQKDKAIHWIGCPATHLEKLLCALFYTVIVFNIFYITCFFAVKSVGFSLIAADPGNSIDKVNWEGNKVADMFRYLITIYIAVQSFYLLGSVYFSRYSYIKTTVTGLLLLTLLGLYLGNFLHKNFLHEGQLWGLTSFKIWGENGAGKIYKLPSWTDVPVKILLVYAWAPVFWIAALLRLREKEI